MPRRRSTWATLWAALALTVLTALPVPAAFDETPEAFVRRVYARYGGAKGPGVATDRKGGAPFYSKDMLDGFAASEAVGDGDVGPIDYDPICGCQDYKNLRLKTVTVEKADESAATVRVGFANLGSTGRRTLILARTAAGWRIADIADSEKDGNKSVLAALRTAHPTKRP